MRNVTFGILTPQMSLEFEQLRQIWVDAEACGFESAWIVDHFIPYDYPDRPITDPMLECWMTLAALARETKKMRLGPLVSCNSYRPPQLLAKMAATLDCISGGRLNFAIGAGWLRLEHEAYGYGFPKTQLRIERLGEAFEVIKRMWTEEKASFNGKHYSITGAVNCPKPVQKPHPPFYIGAEHEKILKFAARQADVWNFPSDINAYSPEQYKERVNTIENECDAIGRNPDTIKRSWLGIAVLGKNEKEVNEKVASIKPKPLTKQQVMREIVGTPETCLQRIGDYVDLGVSEFLLIFPERYRPEILHEFSNEVMDRF
jgi:F420-dependent oxidoreductase-like protein